MRQESAHARRIGCLHDVQTLVVGKAPLGTGWALIKGAREGHPAQGRYQPFTASAPTAHALATLAEDHLPGSVSLPVTQQSPQDSRSALSGGLQHEALPSLTTRRLPSGQGGSEATQL